MKEPWIGKGFVLQKRPSQLDLASWAHLGTEQAGREQIPAKPACSLNALTIDPKIARQNSFPSQSVPAAININPGD